MKLIIDIPENMYNDANILMVRELPELKKIIANGVPLPKGHGRLIDAKVAYRKFYAQSMAKIGKEILDTVPTIIESDKGEEE